MSQIIALQNRYQIAPLPIFVNSHSQYDPEHSRLDEALTKSEKRFRSLAENIGLVALVLDTSGNVTFCNQYLLGLIGWREEEILGRNWCDMCVPWEQYPRMLYVSQLANRAIPSRHKNEVFTKSGTTRLIDWYNTILYDRFGCPTGVASIGHEMTGEAAPQTLTAAAAHLHEDDLVLYLGGRMESDRISFVERHLQKCEICQWQLSNCFTHHLDLQPLSTKAVPSPKRTEPRFETDGEGTLQEFHPLSPDLNKVRIINVSKNGLGLISSKAILPGTIVRLRIKDTVELANVRYCSPVGNGEFRIGLRLQG